MLLLFNEDQGGAHTVPQIARLMGLTRQSVRRVADILVGEGLARFSPNPDHKRSVFLELTERGLDSIEAIDRVQTGWSNQIVQSLDAQDLLTTVATIKEISDVLDETAVLSPQINQAE